MNKHQVEGAAKETAGKVQRTMGTVISSRKHEIKGAATEIAGKVQRKYGDLKDDAEKSRERDEAIEQGRR